jgi:flagellar protein FliL
MTDDDVQDEGQTVAPPARSRMGAIALLIGAVLVGGGGGVLLVGPVVAERMAAAPRPDKVEAPVVEAVFTVENVILNPAETMGTRFLMATIVATVDGQKTVDALRSREPEVRDRLMSVLGAKTIEELSDVGQRESLKEELRESLAAITQPARVLEVFLPTFVIQ